MPKAIYVGTPFENVIRIILSQASIDNADHGVVGGLPTVRYHGIPMAQILPDQTFRLVIPKETSGSQFNWAIKNILSVIWKNRNDGVNLIVDAERRNHVYHPGMIVTQQGEIHEHAGVDWDEARRLFQITRDATLAQCEERVAMHPNEGYGRSNATKTRSRTRNIASAFALRMSTAEGNDTPFGRRAAFRAELDALQKQHGAKIVGEPNGYEVRFSDDIQT